MRRFKSALCMIVITILFLSALSVTADAGSFVRGDSDGDGAISVIDATTIQKVCASLPVSRYDETAADVDGDGTVSVIDATYIQKSLARIEIPYLIGETVTAEETGRPSEAASYIPGENELPFIPGR